jgi:hypothetical protein
MAEHPSTDSGQQTGVESHDGASIIFAHLISLVFRPHADIGQDTLDD